MKQINPGVCYVICDRSYRSFHRSSCPLWYATAITRCHLRQLVVWEVTIAELLWGSGPKEPILPAWESREVSLEFFREWTANKGHRKGLQRKGNLLGIETGKGNLSSQEAFTYLADLRIKRAPSYFSMNMLGSSEAFFIKFIVFMLSKRPKFLWFKKRNIALWCIWILLS